MEVEDLNSENFSFLSLLMAPDENDQFTLSSPSSDFITQQQQIPQNYNSMPSFDIINNNNNSNSELFFQYPFPDFQQTPENMSNYLLQIPFSSDYVNDYNHLQNTNTSTQYLPPLPELLSYENTTINPPSNAYFPSPLPNSNSPLPEKDDYTLGSIVANHRQASRTAQKNKKQRKYRRRQSKISEKVYNLGKLLPGGHRHRKCTADMLKEAYKYIQFLQAQIMALQSMPHNSLTSSQLLSRENNVNEEVGYGCCGGGGDEVAVAVAALEGLSRQQLLQVAVNSAAVQVVMADNGWCLVSEEQVEFINRVHARQRIVNQILSCLPI